MIPVSEPFLCGKELENITDCIKSGWISSAGKYIDQFEEQWATYCNRQYGIAVSNGTTALDVAVHCLGLKPGDEVIMPTFTIISCALAIVNNNGTPVLVDSDPKLWTMDVDHVAEKITSKTKAIMPVHIYGHPVDMDPLLDLAEDHNLAIIEDAAEAHGAEYQTQCHSSNTWRRCGSFGTFSCFSFYANKLITTGEGGMVLTDDEVLAKKARAYLNLYFQPPRRFYHESLGNNFRLTNIQAALGVAQIERMDDIITKKRWMAQEYSHQLEELSGLQLPIEEQWAKSVYWMYAFVLSEETGMDNTEFSLRLLEKGIETRPFFIGMHEQPVFQKMGLFKDEKYPIAERIAGQGLYLPSGLTITSEQIATVSNAVKEILSS
ncbi:DegT/DnrJ/EryC1/StrS family aminotransferase [Methanospirillum lacunae]|uniref:Aminotransferase DegT n=1 Tax=Methanospirillum lacunae TaxID=668570 RepID=A0A2V2MRC9_9EURY|nr:DegT/DnrJ/EryC1/StrS family aminotransferase [Methanospirillum lacunae]PWR70692.1 aminotransferase DegT [Methanospirillum lacunae]